MRELTDEERQVLADGQDIADMLDMSGWQKFVARLNRQVDAYLRELEKDAPVEHVPFVRGKLADLRWVLGVPDGFLARAKEVKERLSDD